MTPLHDNRVRRLYDLSIDELKCEFTMLIDELSEKFEFADVKSSTFEDLCEFLYEKFANAPDDDLHRMLLKFIRILFRDQAAASILINEKIYCIIAGKAALLDEKPSTPIDPSVVVEAEMCLVNGLYNSSVLRVLFMGNCSESLLNRIKCTNDSECSSVSNLSLHEFKRLDIDLYDLRLAFILTAYSTQLQSNWLSNGFKIFLNVVKYSLKRLQDTTYSSVDNDFEETKGVICRLHEVLKILFNLFSHSENDSVDSSLCVECISLCSRIIILENVDARLEQSAINVLIVVPHSLDVIFTESLCHDSHSKIVSFKDSDMSFADVMIRATNRCIDGHQEFLSSYFTLLIYLCNQSLQARRYLRLKMIPPLQAKHVQRKPDEGNEMRNKLIRLMVGMSSSHHLAAELLFILCKRNVNRFTKYCGFGNAAGLLANYGLLGAVEKSGSNSNSEDSETDDYKEVEYMVNPVTGYIGTAQENIVHMTEEQKEYETMKLVNAMSKLMDEGIITPGRIEDGRVETIKHILELSKDNDRADIESDD